MDKKLFYIQFFLLFLILQNLSANNIYLNNTSDVKNILLHSSIYIDKTKKLSISQIQDKNFVPNKEKLLGFGYAPDLNVWIKFQLTNGTKKVISKIIEYDNPLTTHILFYEKSNKGLSVIKEGSFLRDKERFTINPIFHITLQPNETKTFYIKTTSLITTLIIKLNLWDNESFYDKEFSKQFVLALFFGAMTILGLYNLFIYFITKDISYMFYVLYIFGIVIHHLIYVGIANIYLISPEVTQFITRYAVLFVAFPIYALALFTKTFINTKQYPSWDNILNGFLVFIPVFVLLVLTTDFFDKYRTLVVLSLFIYLVVLTVYATFKRNQQAYFIFLGWSVILLAALVMFFSSSGIISIQEHFPYVVELALASEALIFSIALAAKIKTLQKQRLEAKRQLIQQQEEEKIHLEEEVDKKTKELKELNQNLEQRVKEEVENVQLIERKLFEAEKMAAMGEMIGNIAHQWRQPLSVISTEASGLIMKKKLNILDDSSFQHSLEHIGEMTQHLSQTIDDFRDYIKGEMKEITFNLSSCIKKVSNITSSSLKAHGIEQILDLDDSLMITSYENALIQSMVNIINNAKDALQEKAFLEEKYIFINTIKNNDTITIAIKDNAGGIPKELVEKIFEPYFTTKDSSKGTGLGLHMTQSMITTSMKGTIEVTNKEFFYKEEKYIGAEFIITLPI